MSNTLPETRETLDRLFGQLGSPSESPREFALRQWRWWHGEKFYLELAESYRDIMMASPRRQPCTVCFSRALKPSLYGVYDEFVYDSFAGAMGVYARFYHEDLERHDDQDRELLTEILEKVELGGAHIEDLFTQLDSDDDRQRIYDLMKSTIPDFKSTEHFRTLGQVFDVEEWKAHFPGKKTVTEFLQDLLGRGFSVQKVNLQ